MNHLINDISQKLADVFPEAECVLVVRRLAEHYLHLQPVDLYMDRPAPADADWQGLWQAVERLRDDCPLQYIIGECEFYGLPLYVTPAVLIPRPETEELTDWVVKTEQSPKPLKILDLCTGSGCIAIALAAKLPAAEVVAVDVSPAALELAQRNAERNRVSVNWMECDLLDESESRRVFQNHTYNIMVSNPPYVTQADKIRMAANVLRYEPHQALFPEGEPLVFYKRIGAFARRHLVPGGRIYFEINESLADETAEVLRSQGFEEVELRRDMRGKWRMVRATID